MKIAVGASATTSNIQGGASSFKIQASGKAFKVLSSSLYNFKPLAVVREISCNARDAHSMCGKLSEPFDVRLPSLDDSHFVVRDYGPGLSDEDILGLYTTYFQSTKTESNDDIGGLGLGSKSPLSYSTSFQVISFHGGKRRAYLAFQNDNGEPDIYRLTETDTDEPTGLEVIVPVLEADIRKFHRSAINVYRFFETRPRVHIGKEPAGEAFYEFDLNDYLLKEIEYAPRRAARFFKNRVISEVSDGSVWAKMGDVVYPVSVKHVFEDERGDEREIKRFYQNARYGKVVVDFGIGELDINAGRESLSYDKATIARLKTVLSTVYSKLIHQVNLEVSEATHLNKAIARCHDYYQFFGDMALDGSFAWRGRQLSQTKLCSIPRLLLNDNPWNKFIAAVKSVSGVDDVRYATVTGRGDISVRHINAVNIDRLHFDYKKPITWIVLDEPTSGSRGTLRDRIRKTFGHSIMYERSVFIIRGVNIITTDDEDTTKTEIKSVHDAKHKIAAVIKTQDVFDDIRFLSELPVAPSANSTANSSSTGAAREKGKVYAVVANVEDYHVHRAQAFKSVEFDECALTPHFYLIGNKSTIKFGDCELAVSRSTHPKYGYSGSFSSDLLHWWVSERIRQNAPFNSHSTASAPVTIHYLSEAEAGKIASNPNWIPVEKQIVRDGAKALSNITEWWNIRVDSPGLYDNDIHRALKTVCSDYNDVVTQWNELKTAAEQQRESIAEFATTLITRCKSVLMANWDEFVNNLTLPSTMTPESLLTILESDEVYLSFREYVATVSPALVCITQRTTNYSSGWEADIARLWNSTPTKMSITDYMDQKIQGTFTLK